jgi:hypothetical protein
VPQPRSAVAELLDGLREAFGELRLPWYLFGAQAALLYGAARLTADVDVTVEPGLEELFASRAHELDVAGIRVPVARAEDLIVMKVLAGRDKDIGDIESVLLAQSGLDLELIRETLRLLEQALDQSDLLPLFEQVLLRTRSKT